MHYLEDELELLDGLPTELKRHLSAIRELDSRYNDIRNGIQEKSSEFLESSIFLDQDLRKRKFSEFQKCFQVAREIGEEKLSMAEYVQLALEKYQEKVEKDLYEFKMELEADSPGTTESIERQLIESLLTQKNLRALQQANGEFSNNLDFDESSVSSFDDVMPSSTWDLNNNLADLPSAQNGHVSRSTKQDERSQSPSSVVERHRSVSSASRASNTPLFEEVTTPHPSASGSIFSAVRYRRERESSSGFVRGEKFFVDAPQDSYDDVYDSEISPPSKHINDSSSSRESGPSRATHRQPPSSHPSQISTSKSIAVSAPSTGSINLVLSLNKGGPNVGGAAPYSQRADNNEAVSSTSRHPILKMPSFAGTTESMHGRPRKLTKRVAQMLAGDDSASSFSQSRLTTYGDIAGTPSFRRRRRKKRARRENDDLLEEQDDEEEFAGSESDEVEEYLDESEGETDDEDDRTWCICNQKSHGNMVACDNKSCSYEWFHYSCVGITDPPKGKWYCPHCTARTKAQRGESADK